MIKAKQSTQLDVRRFFRIDDICMYICCLYYIYVLYFDEYINRYGMYVIRQTSFIEPFVYSIESHGEKKCQEGQHDTDRQQMDVRVVVNIQRWR